MHPHDEEFVDRIFSLVERSPTSGLYLVTSGGVKSWHIWSIKIHKSTVGRYPKWMEQQCVICSKEKLLWQADKKFQEEHIWAMPKNDGKEYRYGRSRICMTQEELRNKLILAEEKEVKDLTNSLEICEATIKKSQEDREYILQQQEFLDTLKVPKKIWKLLPT
jgi:hypothetical protein